MQNYHIPVDFKSLYTGQKLPKSSVSKSVIRHIYLMLMTNHGECGYNKYYGSKLWDSDFDLSITTGNWTQEIEATLVQTIRAYEPRIHPDFGLKVLIEKVMGEDEKNQKQKFSVAVDKLRLKETNEKIDDIDFSIVFSPISIE